MSKKKIEKGLATIACAFLVLMMAGFLARTVWIAIFHPEYTQTQIFIESVFPGYMEEDNERN